MERKCKLFLLLPLVFVSFCLFSCAVKSVPELTHNEILEESEPTDDKVYSNVEEMPTFLGGDTVIGYPIMSRGFSSEGHTQGKKYIMGYPTKPKIILAPSPDEFILLIKN